MEQDQDLTVDDIFGSDDLTISDPIEIKEWTKNDKPGHIYFKVMSADASIKFQELIKDPRHRGSIFVRILQECACKKDGTLLFTTKDLDKLRTKSSAVFLRMGKLLLQLNGMTLPEKTWEAVEAILVSSDVDAAVIARVKAKWDAPDESLKNASGGGPTSA